MTATTTMTVPTTSATKIPTLHTPVSFERDKGKKTLLAARIVAFLSCLVLLQTDKYQLSGFWHAGGSISSRDAKAHRSVSTYCVTNGGCQEGKDRSPVEMQKKRLRVPSSPPSSKLQHHINATNVAILQEEMSLFLAERVRIREQNEGLDDETKDKSMEELEVKILLRSITDQHMVPMLRTIPPFKSLPPTSDESFNGQEKEDQLIYQRFFNEETQKCHQFGNKLFESGAYEGIRLSNTYFFEKRFNLSTILVEAADDNWNILVQNVPKNRSNSAYHHAALCPIGTHSICMQVAKSTSMHAINVTAMKNDIGRSFGSATNTTNATTTTAGAATTVGCNNSIPCFDFDESIRYAFVSLDIEGVEMDFLRMRRVKADIFLVEVVQWARAVKDVITAVELIAYLAEQGYYLYEETIGFRNLVFLSQELVNNCFENSKWDK